MDAARKGWSKRQKAIEQPANRPKTLRRWSDESMLQAIEAVRAGTMGANKAARTHGVPASTLKDRLSGRVKHGKNPGPVPYLSRANAAGSVLPPMLIFKGERFNHEWTAGEVPNTLYGMSDNGWIDQELFFYWLKDLFLKQIPPERPVLLLMDSQLISLHTRGHQWCP